ncbi:MAG: pseudouridine synthase [Motiliproteus sp.]
MRLDRFLSNLPQGSRKQARLWLAAKKVRVNGQVVTDTEHPISAFSTIQLDDTVLQQRQPRYFMLNKPVGYLSATEDRLHPTVMELLDEPDKQLLHIAGRLDRNSTGLLLITDDGRWSRLLTDPSNTSGGQKVAKRYRVDTRDPIRPDTAKRFIEGIYFDYEQITTRPVELEQTGERQVLLTLFEGRYHQIKRMFGRFRNPVLALHRLQIGEIRLDPSLQLGQYRPLNQIEIDSIVKPLR